MGFKMKSSIDKLCGVSPLKRETGDVLTKNIVNTNQKGDEQIRAKKRLKQKVKK